MSHHLPNEGQNDEDKESSCKNDFCFLVKTPSSKGGPSQPIQT